MATKITITKIKEVENPTHPNNIPVGYSYSVRADFVKEPVIGKRFHLGAFSTSLVTKIIDDNTFETLNSVYEISESEL